MNTSDDVLQRLADSARRRVEASKLSLPGYRLRERLAPREPAGRLQRALRREAFSDPLRLLCGIQGAGQAAGALGSAADAAAAARRCEAGGAAALAVATEPERLGGDPAWVEAVRAASPLPVLVDDVVVDEYQLLEAAVQGADGILLIAALCSDVQLQVLASRARLLGLDPLVEVHTAEELARALRAGSTLLGLGSRGSGDARSGLAGALDLLPLVPLLATAVAWGVAPEPGDLVRLRATRCDAALVGEALRASRDPSATLAALAAAAHG